MRYFCQLARFLLTISLAAFGFAADTVPTEIQQPGTQPAQISNLESPDKCDNCHGGYNTTVEPAHNWRGSMMANAGRDPIFWATLAIAEQDFDGAGDLCIRCHSTAGWLAGRSTPTDGSGLSASDADGVECDFCHKSTNPDNSEWIGQQLAPFTANDFGDPGSDPSNVVGYYGSGMASIWGGNEKLGPYGSSVARHQFLQSQFHRSVDFCGTCHDVSNPAVGDLAHNFGAQATAGSVNASGTPGSAVAGKAAFNNLPFRYGVVERTFSEFKSGLLSKTRVSAYASLPAELRRGAVKAAYETALVAGRGGDYEDGSPRYFSCQTCHMRPVNGAGCNKAGAPIRKDLPLHDMTGGNYWMPQAIQYLNPVGKLRLGGGLTSGQIAALNDGVPRVQKQLSEAATLSVSGNTVKVINHTGHKLISGYPEGRRMWLNMKWFDASGAMLREDGEYGPLFDELRAMVTVPNPSGGPAVQVESILDLDNPNTKVYEAHYGITSEWARQLLDLGYSPALALAYGRMSGTVEETLGELAAKEPGEVQETFHFVLNNTVAKDNRIPPYGMSYDEGAKRNALPVPASQYGGGSTGSTYNHWDAFTLSPPAGAVYATIELMYQPTSWEYIQFLYLANNGQNTFLAAEGANLLEAWLNTGMARPYTMASTVWGTAPAPPVPDMAVQSLGTWSLDRQGRLLTPAETFSSRDTVGIVARVVDEAALTPLSGAQVFVTITAPGGTTAAALQGFTAASGDAVLKWKPAMKQAAGVYTAKVSEVIKNGYQFDPTAGQVSVTFTIQ